MQRADNHYAILCMRELFHPHYHKYVNNSQDSILGLLLFTIFINNLPAVLFRSKVMLYADDTTVTFANPSGQRVQEVLTEDPKKSLSRRSREFHWMNGLKWFSPRIYRCNEEGCNSKEHRYYTEWAVHTLHTWCQHRNKHLPDNICTDEILLSLLLYCHL